VLIDRPPFAPNAYNRSAVVFPSEIGGANWGGASYNPDLGLLFINVNELGQIIGTKDPASGPVNLSTLVGNVAGGRQGPYANFGPQGRFAVRDAQLGLIPCNQPPWGSMVAVNVHTGDIAWKSPLGVTEGLPEGKQNTGRPNIAGSIATAGGLVFISGADDSRFRAYEAKTGKEVWTVKMNASGSAVPSTYLGKDGKQYVVITATGGSNSGAPLKSDEVIAFALP
jgi:quinoprotein glucose dehydrogenase